MIESPSFFRWNFDAVYRDSRDITISGLGGHIAISVFASLSHSFGDTFFKLAVVTYNKLIFDSFIMSLDMSVKFRQFQKNHTCLTWCPTTSGAPIGDVVVAFCTRSVYRKSHETARTTSEQKFIYNSKTELRHFNFTPYAIRELNLEQSSLECIVRAMQSFTVTRWSACTSDKVVPTARGE